MGEANQRIAQPQAHELQPIAVDTPGGRIQVQWDHSASASPNAPQIRDVLGTLLLVILAGHKRYAHITGLRSDGLSPQLLGMSAIISEDSLRRALARMSAKQSQDWLAPQLLSSVQTALNTPWILDIDTSIKPLYGKQEGADISFNPHKPGRPSHALHTYWVGNLRLVLDVVLSAGKDHSANKACPGLMDVLNQLSEQQRPTLVRGDCGFGNEPFIAQLEARGQPYLFKLRQSAGVKKLITRQFIRPLSEEE